MGTSALQLGKSGLLAQQKHLDVIGANISNVSTTGYHNSRAEFSSLMSRTLDAGSGSTANRGGVNPTQIGLGVRMSSVTKSFTQGRLSQTGMQSDFGIDGKGFMPVSQLNSDGSVPDNSDWFLTRDGSMELGMLLNDDGSYNQVLVQKASGMPLLGVPGDSVTGVPDGDQDGVYDPGVLEPIEIPSDSVYPPEATTGVFLAGNLNAGGELATQPSKQRSDFYLADGSAMTPATDLADLYNQGGTLMFTDLLNDPTIESSIDVGGKTYSQDFTYGADGTTVADLGAFFESSFFNTTAVPPAGVEGASVQFADDQLVFTGNLGSTNNLSNISLKQNNRSSTNFEEIQRSNGESTRFTADAYDSLGNLHNFDITMVKEGVANNDGQTWRWYANSEYNSTDQLPIGTGTVIFDNNGKFVNASDSSIQINLNNGAVDPLVFNLDFNKISNLANDSGSDATVQGINGFGKGELRDWIVESDGTVVGNYTNGRNREFGRIPILTLTNQAGLSAQGDNLYKQSRNTGDLFVRTAGTSNAGSVRQFTLEDSNVDLAMEMTKMIEAQRAFSSNSKVITTDQEIIQTALDLKR